jgi:hypothetical protein
LFDETRKIRHSLCPQQTPRSGADEEEPNAAL